jgi:glutathione transport system permease protein
MPPDAILTVRDILSRIIYGARISLAVGFTSVLIGALALKESLYVRAARSLGASKKRIMFVHIMPGTLSSVIIYFTLRIGTSIITAASLSFLGLGAQPPTPEWGAMLAESRDYIGVADHMTIFPGIAIFLTVLFFNLFGDGLRAALDPKLK